MKKFTANYLFSDSGEFLKNGIVVADDDGTILEYIDTTGNLKEIAKLTFLNGILISAFNYTKTERQNNLLEENPIVSFVVNAAHDLSELPLLKFLDLCKSVQEEFPKMKIPEIYSELSTAIERDGRFQKQKLRGLFLIRSLDLPELRFKQSSNLKQIL
jgi:hypothetical protein